jgi:UDP-N-acetylglucosamine--N-acetylmuramyl-(pentapeptide) pyrophosphoryl-undecaprenol N-acetylglucosamine transferase
MTMRVIIAGGGTGGHVIPAIAIAQELRSRYNAEVLFVGTARGIETRLVPAAGFPLELINVGALNRVSLTTRLKTLIDLPRAIAQSGSLIRKFKPDVMIGVGGYASGPAMLAAAMTRIPMMAFEPNVVPGVANRIAARWVKAAAVQFEATQRYFQNAVVTGVPVRREFLAAPARSLEDRPTLLVFGGSQGAHAINVAVVQALPELAALTPGIHLIHQTGQNDFEAAQAAAIKAGISAEVCPFIDDMPAAFARADLLICRSGASTVAEVAASGKPAIFIPLPTAADDHQRHNAETLANAEAARLLPQSELTSDRLSQQVAALLCDRSQLLRMGAAARHFAHPDAATEIAATAARLAGISRAQDVA